MAQARALVGLDVHAAKIVAAGLDADTGELKAFAMKGDVPAAAGFCAGLPRPSGSRTRPDRPGTRSRASSRSGAWSAWSLRRRRSRARPETGSRPIGVTPSISSGCCSPASCTRSASRAVRRKRCVILFARARRCGWV